MGGGYDMEMPARVERVTGALGVDFPWAEAEAAVGELRDLADALEAEFVAHEDMVVADLGAWAGPFRDEFDDDCRGLEWGVVGDLSVAGSLRFLAESIIEDAEEVCAVQVGHNEDAESLTGPERQAQEHLREDLHALPDEMWDL